MKVEGDEATWRHNSIEERGVRRQNSLAIIVHCFVKLQFSRYDDGCLARCDALCKAIYQGLH